MQMALDLAKDSNLGANPDGDVAQSCLLQGEIRKARGKRRR